MYGPRKNMRRGKKYKGVAEKSRKKFILSEKVWRW